jgi:site-specific DNA recombinase
MRAAIYARVSSERQEKEHTIGSQLEALRNYAAQRMNIVEEFTDEGYSGARFGSPGFGPHTRPGGASRIRSAVDLLYGSTGTEVRAAGLHSRGLERFGVKAIFLERGAVDDPLSKFMPQITGAVAEFGRAKITERNRRVTLSGTVRRDCLLESSLRLCARSAL